MGTKTYNNYEDLITYTRASKGHALRPVSYGDELVTNGTFNTDVSGWTETDATTVSLSYDAGRLRVLSTAPYEGVYQDITTTVGRIYSFTRTVEGGTGTLRFRTYAGPASGGLVDLGGISAIDNGAGSTETFIFIATSTTTRIQMQSWNTFADFWLDNISVKEVTFDESDGTLTLFEHPDNVPRVEWDSAGNRLGLLVEEARTNLLPYSEDFTVQSGRWANGQKGDTSLTSGLTESPSMSDSVWKLFATSGTGTQIIQEDATVSGATNVVGSVYLKKAEYKYGGIRLLDSSPSTGYSVFIDLDDGSVFDTSTRGTPTTSDYRVQDAGNGWWRLSVITSSDGGSVNFTVGISDGTSINSFDCVSFAGDGTSGIYIWGAQVEEGSFPTSYMKNEGTASGKDRSADVASIPVADFGFNQSAFTLLLNASWQHGSLSNKAVDLTNSNDSERVLIYNRGGTVGSYAVWDGNNVQAVSDGISSTTDFIKVGVGIAENNFALINNGVVTSTDTLGTVPTPTDLKMRDFNGHIKSIQYYPRRLTNAQIQALTS